VTSAPPPYLDVAIQATLVDDTRRFELDVRFTAAKPFAALYGPSGAGKTLTLQAIAGLLRPTQGHITVGDSTLFNAAQNINIPAQHRRVGYLFQNYALFPHLTVRQNIEFGLTSWLRRRVSPEQRRTIDDLLDSFGLSAMADSRPATLSGGQQQRTALARALACQPRLLLLDEPFAALNAMLRQELREELAQTCRRWHIPTLMITHDVDDVLALADTAFVYEHGQIVREVDLHSGLSTEHARRALVHQEPRPVHPLHDRIKALLG